MKFIRFSIVRLTVASLLALTACDDAPSAPITPTPVPSTPKYDLLYSTLTTQKIFIQRIDGGAPISAGFGIDGGVDPDVSKDGRFIVYAKPSTKGGNAITVIDRITRQAREITDGTATDEEPAFSPDGSRIAFVSDRDEFANIYIVNRDGSNLKQLTTEPLPAVIADRSPTWSPDGSRIYWSSNMDGFVAIWTMNPDGTDQRRFTTTKPVFEDDAAWSPDGKRLAYFEVLVDIKPRLVIINADGSDRLVVNVPPAGYGRFPAWSPDSKLLAFTFQPDDHSRPQLYTMNADGTNVQRRLFDGENRGAVRAVFIPR